MRRLLDTLNRFISELRKRRVHRVGAVYAVTLFVILQVGDALSDLGIPTLWVSLLLVAGVAGFPVAILVAWMLDLTDDGVQQAAPGPFSHFFGGTRIRRSLTALATVGLGAVLGWGTWHYWVGPAQTSLAATAVEGEPEAEGPWNARRIAVLYLDDHSEDGSLGYLASAVTEGLLHELGNVEGLEVASRQAVKPYRDQPVSMDSVIRALRVGSVVEGSLMRAGDQVRATIQLIDGETLAHLDSRIVDGTLENPIAFQDSVTQTVARALRQRLGREIRLRTARSETDEVEAWNAFARGREELERVLDFRRADEGAATRALLRADSLFAVAQAADPDWSAPLVQRGIAAVRLASLGADLPGAMDTTLAARAGELFDAALALEPGSAPALEARGWYRYRLARTPGVSDPAGLNDLAEADLRAALAINPELARAWQTLSEVLVEKSQFVEAVEAAQNALEADAFLEVEAATLLTLFNSVANVGPSDEAVTLCNEGRRRFPESPNFILCRFYLLESFPQVEPDVARARALLDSLLLVSPDPNRESWRTFGTVWLAGVMARAGQTDSARVTLDRARDPGETPPSLGYNEAHVQLLLGDRAEAVRLLRLYLTSDPDTAFLREDWWFEDLRDYPAFRDLVGLEGTAPGS